MIYIFIVEKYDNIPFGVMVQLCEFERSGIKNVELVRVSGEKSVIEFINSLNYGDTILFPIYYNPSPLLDIIIKKIRDKNIKDLKLYACGPLVAVNPDSILNNLNVDDIITDNAIEKLLGTKHQQVDKKIEIKKSVFNIENYEFDKDDNKEVHVIVDLNTSCNNNCGFCRSKLKTNKYEYKDINENILSLLPQQEEISTIQLQSHDIFCNIAIEDLDILLRKINEKKKTRHFKLWSDTRNFLKNSNKMHLLNNSNYKILWQIGFESFSDSQLKRYTKKTTVKENLEVIEFFKNNADLNSDLIPLFLIFEPWVSPDEIYQSYNLMHDNNILKDCKARGGLILSELSTRSWVPYFGTNMYYKALNEKLFLKNSLSKFGSIIKDSRFSWKFKNRKSFHLHKQLKEWSKEINYNCEFHFDKDEKEEFNICSFCLGDKGKFKFSFQEIEEKLIQWIFLFSKEDKKEQEVKLKIDNLIQNNFEEMNQLFNL